VTARSRKLCLPRPAFTICRILWLNLSFGGGTALHLDAYLAVYAISQASAFVDMNRSDRFISCSRPPSWFSPHADLPKPVIRFIGR
jgi:hypothetical protein